MDPSRRSTAAILVAAGRSTRMGGRVRKPLVVLHDRTVIEWCAAAFDAVRDVREIVLVAAPEDEAALAELARRSPHLGKVTRVVPGGAERADSVRAGVAAADPAHALVAVHDAARPLVEPATIEQAIERAAQAGAALVAVPVADTIKESADGEHARATLDRSALWAAQTPQVFEARRLRDLLERARAEGWRPTDEAALWERHVGPVPIVRGTPENRKLTTAADLELARVLLAARRGAPAAEPGRRA